MKLLWIWIQISFNDRRLVKPHFIFGRMSVHRGIQRIVIFLVKAVWLRIFWHIHYDACIFIVLWRQKLFAVFIFGRMSLRQGRSTELFGKGCKIIEKLIAKLLMKIFKSVWLEGSVQMTLALAVDLSEIFCSAVKHIVVLLPEGAELWIRGYNCVNRFVYIVTICSHLWSAVLPTTFRGQLVGKSDKLFSTTAVS